MKFNKFSIDGDLGDLSEEEAKATLSNFMEQHEENVQFVTDLDIEGEDELESLRAAQEENMEYTQRLAEEIADFDQVPLSADELAGYDLSRLHEMKDDLADFDEVDGEEEEDEPEFSKKERKSPNFKEQEDGPSEDLKASVSGIKGVTL